MTDWQPLSVRRGLRLPQGLIEGVPPGLRYPLEHWLQGAFGYRSAHGMADWLIQAVALRVGLHLTSFGVDGMNQILAACDNDEDVFLDVLDATLALCRSDSLPRQLGKILDDGGSTWCVSDDGCGLEVRVEATAQSLAQLALKPADEASLQLSEAWSGAYGLHANPSDAWDHAIKAVEAVLIPLVVPNKAKATLGDVLGELKANSSKFSFVLPFSASINGVPTVEAMLRLMWPNPDRHGGTGTTQQPTVEQARSVVQVATIVVQWMRDGALKR